MKRKVVAVVLAVMLLFPLLAAAERWAKGFDFTFPEFEKKYNSVPEKIYGEPVPLFFLNLGVSDFRKVYYAEVKPLIEVIVLAEDTTDKVVNVVIKLKNDSNTAYVDQVEAGKSFARLVGGISFATGDSSLRDPLTTLKNEFGFPHAQMYEDNLMEYDDRGITYAMNYTNDTVMLSFRLTEFYQSKEEFLAYRDTTMPSK